MHFTVEEILQATAGQLVGNLPDGGPFVIETDSRRVLPGSVFWALRGESFDGHDFVRTAAERGAALSVVEHNSSDRDEAAVFLPPVIRVPCTLKALGELAGWHRQRLGTPVIGITGSVGKTTTREMIHAVLSQELSVLQSPRNFNNHIGVPLSLLQLQPHHQAAVIELGASAVGEIRDLCHMAAPQLGIVTRIGRAHVGEFGSIESIVEAKGELIESLPADGLAVLPGDDPWCQPLADRARCRILRVGTNPDSDFRAHNIRMEAGRLHLRVEDQDVCVPVSGRHFAGSVLMALAVAREWGIPIKTAAEALALLRTPPGRSRVVRSDDLTVIDDTYNASPEAVEAAIRLLAEYPASGRRFLVIGDMRELGSESQAAHEEAGIQAVESRLDGVFALGDFAETVVSAARAAGHHSETSRAFSSIEELSEALMPRLAEGDVVLLKGSRAMRMERLVERLLRWGGPTANGEQTSQRERSLRHAGLVD